MKIEIHVDEDTERGLRYVLMEAIGGGSESQHIVKIVKLLTEALKEGKEGLVRVEPTLERHRDFDTGKDHYMGRSRFSVPI